MAKKLIGLDVFVLTGDNLSVQQIEDYARFLDKEIHISMFEGDQAIFKPGKYVDIQPSTEWNYYSVNGNRMFRDSNLGKNTLKLFSKLRHITDFDIEYK